MDAVARPIFSNQFVISVEATRGYDSNANIGGWFVGHNRGYPSTRILDSEGEPIGAFLGTVIDPDAKSFRAASITIPWRKGSDKAKLEESLYKRAGSWIAIIATAEIEAIYPDACGSIPLVYFENRKLAGSSAAAVLDENQYFRDLYDEAKSETWFRADWYHTAGLTAHRSLRRLLPNHRLDLKNWRVERIWPLNPFPALPIDQVVDEVSQAARDIIAMAVRGKRALVPLTAGNETRALLSLVRKNKADALFFTGSFPGAVVDLGVANRLAKRFQLRHVVTPVQARTPDDALIWRRRTGHCVGGAIGLFKMDRNRLSSVEVELSGAAGEVGRGFLWSPADKANDKLTSDILLARLKLPRIDRFVMNVDEWLNSVAQFDAFTIMDLAYIELKMACWAGPQATGAETDVAQIWPFSSRRSFAAMMSAPPHVRLEQSLFRRIVEKEWPELLDIPINKGTALENARNLIYRASSPRRVWNKVRKSFAKLKSMEKIA